jgi:hypothetical protein
VARQEMISSARNAKRKSVDTDVAEFSGSGDGTNDGADFGADAHRINDDGVDSVNTNVKLRQTTTTRVCSGSCPNPFSGVYMLSKVGKRFVKFVDMETSTALTFLKYTRIVELLHVSCVDMRMVCVMRGDDGCYYVDVWDLLTSRQISKFRGFGAIFEHGLHVCGDHVLVGTRNQHIYLLNVASKSEIFSKKLLRESDDCCVRLTRNILKIIVASDRTLTVYDTEGTLLLESSSLPLYSDVRSILVSPDEEFYCLLGRCYVLIVDAVSLTMLSSFSMGSTKSACFGPTGHLIISSKEGFRISNYETGATRLVHVSLGDSLSESADFNSVAYNQDSNTIIGATFGSREVHVVDFLTGIVLASTKGISGRVVDIHYAGHKVVLL